MQLVVALVTGIGSVVAPESGVFVQGSIFFLLPKMMNYRWTEHLL